MPRRSRNDDTAAPVPKPRSQVSFPLDVLSPVRDGLWLAVNGAGTAYRARMAGYDVVGKTGTAQVASLENTRAAERAGLRHLRDNSWFVFYAPRDNPQIAGVIFVEHGGFGATASVPSRPSRYAILRDRLFGIRSLQNRFHHQVLELRGKLFTRGYRV